MRTDEDTPFYRAIGLALGEAHWDLAAQPLPLTEIDLHVTGERGSLTDSFRSLCRLVRRIEASGRVRPTPVEQDYLTGYARELLQTPSSPFFLDPPALKAALDCPCESHHAPQEKTTIRTAHSQDVT